MTRLFSLVSQSSGQVSQSDCRTSSAGKTFRNCFPFNHLLVFASESPVLDALLLMLKPHRLLSSFSLLKFSVVHSDSSESLLESSRAVEHPISLLPLKSRGFDGSYIGKYSIALEFVLLSPAIIVKRVHIAFQKLPSH